MLGVWDYSFAFEFGMISGFTHPIPAFAFDFSSSLL